MILTSSMGKTVVHIQTIQQSRTRSAFNVVTRMGSFRMTRADSFDDLQNVRRLLFGDGDMFIVIGCEACDIRYLLQRCK